ncbi:tail fiber protein [Bacteroides phage vB_BfraS_NCTC]|nr:tail fiber protein [Bacteroides phage vB_BfraS_NCTC]
MEVHNNFSPLAFRKKESKATYEKWYAFGKNYAIPASANTLTPFQFTELNIPVFDPNTIEVEVINEETGEAKKSGVYVSFDVMPEHGGVLYVSPGKNSFREALPQGTYRARFSIGDQVYISTPFCVIPGIETSSKYLLIEYWNDEKIAYPGGFITTGANNDFRYQMYVPATICKPKYEFEEELTKRAGYKFLELQTSTKVYAFTFVAPEFICDAMRLIRLSDYIRISHDGEYYNALNFEFDVDWQEQLYLAAVDCQFETDSIIQKLPSFNRRDKASFYNALLANIDTPIMFSPDTVGLYYKEYRETEPVVKGKLIRELSPIDLIDENTTIAVDLGTGEARKFNLYRMLQDYISKSHEDATNFLLHLRGGATFGDDISGSAAHINSAGDARFNDVDADAVSADAVDVGSWLSVGNTAFTVSKSGKTDTGEFTARGKAYLTEDVYTGGGTGTITKDGQLKYLSAIIQQFLSSPTFVSGFLGEGFKIWVENGNWHIECDNLTVRQTMNIFELLIQKIRSVNGALVVSQSNGKLSEVKEVGEQYKLTTGEEFPTFQEGDLVRCQTFAGYQGAGLTFDFTQFAKFDYSGGSFDSSLVDVTPDSISFNLNDTGNSGFAFYKMQPSSETPIEMPSFILILEGAYPGMMAVATGLDSNDSPVESAGVLLKNGENVIPAITLSQGIHNFAITVVGDSGHGTGKVTVKQKRADGSAPSNSFVKFYWVEVKSVDGTSFFVDKSEFNGVVPAVGDEVVQMGNTKNPERQALIYITAQESGHPYIEILNGVKTKSLSGTNRTRLGDLSNIQDSAFPEGQQPSGSGLYCDNAFLRGIFLLRNGKSVEDEVNQAKQDAANAATEAERAQQTAQEAKDRLNKWADDGFISPTEKPALIDEGKRIQAEFLQIKNNADKYGVSVTEYTKAYEDYLNELRYHSAQQPEDIAVRPELAKTQTIYYDRRNGALNAIANAAKDYVDEADKKLKEYLDTEITAIPGKIELAVRSLKTANYNLLANSNMVLNGNPYQLGVYRYETHLVVGKSYTLTVCYKCADSSSILAYNNAGGGHVAEFPKSDNETIVSVKISPFNEDLTYFEFYKLPQKETTQTYVKWAVITEGDIGVSNWIPSKSGMFSGGSNLVLNSGVCVDDYALFGLSKTYYELRGQDVVISFDYEYSNLVLGSNNRFGVETEVPLSTGGVQYFGAFLYVDSRSPSSGKGRYSYALKVSDNVVDNGLKHIQAHVQVGSGTVVKIYNFQIEKGNTPTGWKPAPEDILNDSKKYTDTQILAVDGKIELTVKTKVENLGIGANNLFSYTSSDLNNLGDSYVAVEKINDIHGFKVTGENHGRNTVRIPNIIPPIPGKYTVSGWIKGSQSTTPGITIDVCDSDSYRVLATPDNNWSYFKHTFDVSKNTEDQKDIYNFVDLGDISWAYIWVKDFKVESGEIATAWSPNIQDGVYRSAEYTNQQISVVEGKITTTVEKLTEVDGKVTGLASRVEQTEKSITSVVGDINVLNSTTNRHITKQIDLTGWDNNKFFPLVIDIPVGRKSKVEIDRPLKAAYGTPSYGTHEGGFSMNLSFEMSGSGWGSSDVVINIFDYVRSWSSGKIVVDLGQITESSDCVIGIRGGSKYNVTVYDTTDQSTVNVYQADYTGPYGQVFPVRTDGTEPVRTYGYYSEIKQTQESISATVARVDDQGRRLSAAELTLTADNARIGVVENGLVNTGINITSRKIVLKSDNVLFQNNAGQQTAAINANGKLTANAIEVGEVVAGGFAAQRITTGNLTVTDGAVIGGMTITGGVLTGKNINIQDGAKIGNFTIVSGIFSAQNTPAGIQMTLSNNAATFDSSGVRVEHNSGGYALTTTGNGRVFLTGSNFWVQCKDVDFMGAQTWKAPGVFYACTILANGAIGKTWGNPDFHITRVTKNSTGRYTVNTTGSNGDYFVMITAYDPSSWLSTTVEPYSEGQFTYKVFDVNNGMCDGGVIIYFCGMVK